MTRVVDGIRRWRRTTEHGIGKGDNKGGQGQCVGALEVRMVAACRSQGVEEECNKQKISNQESLHM
jgi:hypothetical protein